MADEEFEKKAWRYASNHLLEIKTDSGLYAIAQAYIAGAKENAVVWHDLRKNPEDLPETLHPVYAKLDSGTYVFAYCVNGIWHRNDDGIILYHGDGKSEVIAWCEIPRYRDSRMGNNGYDD